MPAANPSVDSPRKALEKERRFDGDAVEKAESLEVYKMVLNYLFWKLHLIFFYIVWNSSKQSTAFF